jgi:hypothetical protein
VPWTAAGCAGITVGLLWDISWHASIGRDTFWTPAHVTIYLGALMAGLAGAWEVLRATFGPAAAREGKVTVWGMRAPLGAWVQVWGSATMLTAAGFDAWWHGAYGLDLGILTPAHTALGIGMVAVHAGALFSVATPLNRAAGPRRRWLERAFVFQAGTLLFLLAILLIEVSYPNRQRGAAFYQLSAAAYPAVLAATARAAGSRWAATRAAAVYTGLALALLWTLPLFPAQPRLAPIFNPVDHMWPGLFPLLLLVPAVAMDRLARLRPWLAAPLAGAAFLALLLAAQWPLSAFLLGPGARNRLFAGDQWYFGVTSGQEGIFPRLGEWRHAFWDPAPTAAGLGLALLLAVLSTGAGLAWGGFLARLRR